MDLAILPTSEAKTDPGSTSEEHILCASCSQLNLEGVKLLETNRWEATYGNGIFVSNVAGRYRSLQTYASTCPLCIVFTACRAGSATWSNHDEIRAFSYLRYSGICSPHNADGLRVLRESNTLVLVLVDRTLLNKNELRTQVTNHVQNNACAILRLQSHDDMVAVRRFPHQFNTGTVLSWLQYCENHHGPACRSITPRLVSFDLIDCQTLGIRTYEGSKQVPYVALSYVWGLSSDKSQYSIEEIHGERRIGPSPPRVISDAIAATKALGLPYLWVDKFCMRQDQAKKEEQIRNMDLIYEKATLTIVAAAGSDETFGLPGIGTTEGKALMSIQLSQATITWPIKDPQLAIRSSKWATRGWTFQESSLSRRCLVFLEDQVYFECNSMNYFENIQLPFEAVHTRSRLKIGHHMRSGLFGKSQESGTVHHNPAEIPRKHSLYQYMSTVEQYTGRELGQDSDSLNDFEGLLRRFRHRLEPLLDAWGLCHPIHRSHDLIEFYFLCSLSWHHVKDYSSGEMSKPRRIPDFPSWTWAGWAGQISYGRLKIGGTSRNPISFLRSVHLESPSGITRRLTSFQQSRKARRGEKILRLEGKVLPKNLFDREEIGVTWYLSEEPSGQVQYVLIGSLPPWEHTQIALVLRAHSVGETWLRIGLCFIECRLFDVYKDCGWSIFRIE